MTRIKHLFELLPTFDRRRAAFLALAIPFAYSMCQPPAASGAPATAEPEHSEVQP